MLMLPDISSTASVSKSTSYPSFTAADLRALEYLQLTFSAERHLISAGKACPDHQSCKRLAFARFLYLTERLNDNDGR